MNSDIQLQEQLADLFPYTPYPSQLQLALDIYQELENCVMGGQVNKVVIVESPTGTGKTYALLVSTVKWLQEHPEHLGSNNKKISGKNQDINQQDEESQMPSWLIKPKDIHSRALIQQKQQKIKNLKTIANYKSDRNKWKSQKNTNNQQNQQKQQKIQWQNYEQQENDQDNNNLGVKRKGQKNRITLRIDDQQQEQCLPKIIFASRTHSQLSQVIQSLDKIGMPVRAISLASKDHLCVHPKIQKNKTHQKCQYLLSHGGCPYYHQEDLEDFLNITIEDAKKTGQQHSLCSYYGVKNLTPIADLICLPYISILNPQIRQKLKININNAIIIFDQAHNLIEQQLNMKSPEITYESLKSLKKRIQSYQEKYGNKLNMKNREIIRHLQEIISSFMRIIEEQSIKFNEKKENLDGYVKFSKIQFFIRLKIMEIKLSKIKYYIALSNFDQKLAFFGTQVFPMSILNTFIDILTQLTSLNQTFSPKQKNNQSTIILIKLNNSLSSNSIKILCLESSQLHNIFKKSKITILAGGTMQPIQQFITIFQKYEINYKFYKYPHVIKQKQCGVFVIGQNKAAKKIKFTHKQTKDREQLKKLLICVKEIIQNIIVDKTEMQAGTVIFIQSYQIIGFIEDIIGNQLCKFPVFYDSKDKNKNAFEQYSEAILKKKSSAILVSVMGGKLSQGINFTDKLARSIIVLGLPYPNLKAPQLIQKMKYLDNQLQNNNQIKFTNATKIQHETENGQKYYENCCLKTLNQTIGRGIRHINDYANIYLIDDRFTEVAYKLSEWLTKRIQVIS